MWSLQDPTVHTNKIFVLGNVTPVQPNVSYRRDNLNTVCKVMKREFPALVQGTLEKISTFKSTLELFSNLLVTSAS